jgi:transcriptional regulator with PAS, ATPase and Fis domain
VALRGFDQAAAATPLRHAAAAAVLLQGETGTGKARRIALHRAGPRAGAAFVDINCAAIPGTLLESRC